jgi:UDP-N-acetylglucosamine--N-acetylmuramyl-(pentapeptide) pyrophosphoryl-undecaprenol N-acetylglucosamine transferase
MVRQFDPQVAIGVGGYVSLPVMWAAQQQGVPTVLHEQNRLMGLANRKLAPKASRVFLTFDDTKGPQPEDRTEVVGNPVRPGFVSPPEREAAREALGLDAKTPVVLVYGGSQGARRINEALAGALPGFREGEAAFIWGAGPGHIRRAREAAAKAPVQVAASPFIDDMPAAFAAADLVVARSGASTTSELAAMGKPAILVPYPHATDNHQEHNARAMEAAGAARVLLDGDCTAEALAAAIRELLSDRHGLAAMGDAARGLAKINAAERIVDGVFELVFEGRD